MKNTVLTADIVESLERQVAKERAEHAKRLESWPKEDVKARKALAAELRAMATKVEATRMSPKTDFRGSLRVNTALPQKPDAKFCSRLTSELARWKKETRTKVSLDGSDFTHFFPEARC